MKTRKIQNLALIGDQWVKSSAFGPIRNPYSGDTVAEVTLCTKAMIDQAISAASLSEKSMADWPREDRHRTLSRVAKALGEQVEPISQLMVAESGKPITAARAEVRRGIQTLNVAAAETLCTTGQVLPGSVDGRGKARTAMVHRVPRGVIAAITPFNFPLNLVLHKIAPALAVGAPIILKPSHQCPLTALALGEIFLEAGLPKGALQIVPCLPETAQHLIEDPRVKVVSFTGSDKIGWKIKQIAWKKHVLLELGGNAPCIIDEGIDYSTILPDLLTGCWTQSGQVCIKLQNLLVPRSIFSGFCQMMVNGTQALKCGDPRDDTTTIGPLIDEAQVSRLSLWIDEAVKGGAKLLCGGTRQGNILTPAILTDVKITDKIFADEVFGPVCTITPYTSFEEAIALCNQGRFGLQAGVFTTRIDHMEKAFANLNFGGVLVNDIPTFRLDHLPYGGTKDSGCGREGVRFAMEEFSEYRVHTFRQLPKGDRP